MELYTEPRPDTYEKHRLFYMPTNNSESIRSIAVSKRSGDLFLSGYTIVLAFMFTALWSIILYLVLAFFPSMDSPNRHVLMVGFRNSGDPITALEFMFGYTFRAFSRMKTKDGGRDWRTFGWSCLLLFAAICGYFGSVVAGILVSTEMVVGSAAPAKASRVFFATPPKNMTNSERLRAQSLRAPAAMRAIGSVDASDVTLQSRVTIRVDGFGGDNFKYSYRYTVNGWDLGLQKYPGFRQIVEGECATEYSWLNRDAVGVDEYFPWGDQNEIVIVQKTAEEKEPPRAEIRVHPNNEREAADGGKILFAIIPHTVGRGSFTLSSDPWYKTIPTGETSEDDARDKVDSGRPALSCWQRTNYTYNGYNTNSVFQLEKLKGFNIPQAWDNHLRVEFGLPKIIDLVTSLGRDILLSSATYLDGYFDAGSSSVKGDIERLVLGSFVASREIFRDSTMATGVDELRNAAKSGGRPQPGVGDFIIRTGKVTALRLDILAGVPAITAGFFLISLIIPIIFRKQKASNGGFRARFCARFSALQATQLYRYMDEHLPTTSDEEAQTGTNKRWEGRLEPIPYIGRPDASDPTSSSDPRPLKPRVVLGADSRPELVLTRDQPPEITPPAPWNNMNILVREHKPPNGSGSGNPPGPRD